MIKEEMNNENPDLKLSVKKDSKIKEFLVEYTGNKINPENDEITVEMIAEVMIDEFPEFMMAIAEENWIRGYHQGLVDVDEGIKIVEGIKKENNSAL